MKEQEFYATRLAEYGPTPHGVGWAKDGSTQRLRFGVLLAMSGLRDHETVLDAGCGVGHLLKHIDLRDRYIGVDRIPKMIEYARDRHPTTRFECQDLLTFMEPVDVVLANGLIALGTQKDAAQLLTHLFSLAHRVLVFNALTTWGPRALVDLVWEPASLLAFCSGLTRRLAIRHDYLPADMTVALWKRPFPLC